MPKYYKNFDNKTAIITGGAGGLGAGIAKTLADFFSIVVNVYNLICAITYQQLENTNNTSSHNLYQ